MQKASFESVPRSARRDEANWLIRWRDHHARIRAAGVYVRVRSVSICVGNTASTVASKMPGVFAKPGI
ncbi:MAG: hypothetical protein CMJ78_17175 [Planctomycetaceae bacterium]|nr:hypothetical protein [Planctomycetaceae bacterium]